MKYRTVFHVGELCLAEERSFRCPTVFESGSTKYRTDHRNRHIPQGITVRDYRDRRMQGTPTTTEFADGMVAIKITWTNRLVEDEVGNEMSL